MSENIILWCAVLHIYIYIREYILQHIGSFNYFLLVAASISSCTVNVGSRRSIASVDAAIAKAGCYVSSSTTRLTHWQRPSAASSSYVCCGELACLLTRTSFDGRPDCLRSSSLAHTTLHKVPKGAIWVAVHLSPST